MSHSPWSSFVLKDKIRCRFSSLAAAIKYTRALIWIYARSNKNAYLNFLIYLGGTYNPFLHYLPFSTIFVTIHKDELRLEFLKINIWKIMDGFFLDIRHCLAKEIKEKNIYCEYLWKIWICIDLIRIKSAYHIWSEYHETYRIILRSIIIINKD